MLKKSAIEEAISTNKGFSEQVEAIGMYARKLLSELSGVFTGGKYAQAVEEDLQDLSKLISQANDSIQVARENTEKGFDAVQDVTGLDINA